jgi:hypothetical protein
VVGKSSLSARRAWHYECRCSCGGIVYPLGSSLKNGNTKSCGCLQKEAARKNGIKLPFGESSFRKLFRDRQREAVHKGREWALTKSEFRSLTASPCHYCGVPPRQSYHGIEAFGPYIYNGLDRLDSSGGYTAKNVVPCCWTCNMAKNAQSLTDFIAWIKRVHSRLAYFEKQA